MVDIKKQLVTTLRTATSWNVYYEALYKAGTLPAITYREIENNDLYNGDTISFSTLRYEIKVWATSMDDLITQSQAIDLALKAEGWSRYSSVELTREAQLIKVLRYVATGYREVN